MQLTGAIFAGYGLAFILAPVVLSRFVTESVPASTSGLIDLRATYGGMSLAIGVLLFMLSGPAQLRTGLWAVLCLMAGMAGGRAYGMLVDGQPNGMMYLYLVLELVTALASAALIAVRTPPTANTH